MQRVMAIDYGERRMGLALSDPTRTIAQPFKVLTVRHAHAAIEPLTALIQTHAVDTIVVGLPLLNSGKEGEMAERVRRWTDKLAAACDATVDIHLIDERLTSQWAARVPGRSRGRKAAPRDDLAAQALLETYLLRAAGSR